MPSPFGEKDFLAITPGVMIVTSEVLVHPALSVPVTVSTETLFLGYTVTVVPEVASNRSAGDQEKSVPFDTVTLTRLAFSVSSSESFTNVPEGEEKSNPEFAKLLTVTTVFSTVQPISVTTSSVTSTAS